jgi:hypothetical protein
MFQTLLPIQYVDILIIHKHFQKFLKVSPKDLCHGSQEGTNNISHANWHDCPSK